ncbi:hypothetical protein [Egbenema bharatensis]
MNIRTPTPHSRLPTPVRAIRVRAASPKELSPLLLTPHSRLLTPQ